MTGMMDRVVDLWWQWMSGLSWQVALMVLVTGAFCYFQRRGSARALYWLWLLVFLKLLVPPRGGFPGGISTWTGWSEATALGGLSFRGLLFGLWLAGIGALLLLALVRLRRFSRWLVEDGKEASKDFRRLVREISREVGLESPPEMVVIEKAISPLVCGWLRPRLVFPADLINALTKRQLRIAVMHEVIHLKRRDLIMNTIQNLLQLVYWFHPLVWLAGRETRNYREMVVDETVVSGRRGVSHKEYGDTMLMLSGHGAPPVSGTIGIAEPSTFMFRRFIRLMESGARERKDGMSLLNWAVVALFALVFIPMGMIRPGVAAGPGEGDAPVQIAQGSPSVVSTSPRVGQSEVDPALKEIVVTFEQDMGGGFSWTGGGEVYPKVTGKPFWRDGRTCVLPVQLEAGKFYRVGINSKSHKNFRSKSGTPVRPGAIYFTTQGAPDSLKQYLNSPRVVDMNPANGATGVSPAVTELRVTFNQEMGGGFSWTGGGPRYPETTDRPRWEAGGKVCVLPVRLKPGWRYALGLNSPSHKNFSNKMGVPLMPMTYTFETSK